ncbi:DUF4335 domain-containing protein [Leptolyngbya sp. BC1307]|uniref:DUF4335 domain-containing protein n=1 Tax=Leptolyngbya sp. BC1307 TaxID=2029589 RepID=UPI000EFC2498|nr:DUF4335 domain-containing protein [Leptolyngbya sp. BC1307]
MTIRRQYQLPNCSLVLDGLSTDAGPGSEAVMSLLVNAECQISGQEKSLNGGYSFFAALVRAVSQYAQEVLGGFAHPQVMEGDPLLVHINPGDGPYHHLVVQPEIIDMGMPSDGRALDIQLSTVQLFDLTEAVNQFFSDSQTLPELLPALTPLSRRFVHPEVPLSDRVKPAILGIGGLIAATLAIGLLPLPKMRDPALDSRPDSAAEVRPVDGASADAPPTDEPATPDVAALPTEPEASEAVDEPEDTSEIEPATPAPTDSATDRATAEPAREPVAAQPLAPAPSPATPPSSAEVATLNDQLRRTLVENREQPRVGSDSAAYRVRITEDGTITGYEPLGQDAVAAIDETPLASLVESAPAAAPSVDYRVVFTERGVIEVSPWEGWSYYE